MPTPFTATSRRATLSILQIYRGIAAILVALFHITSVTSERFNHRFADNVFSLGYTGVDFFFVLSGFIIFYTHLDDIGVRSKVRSYFIKRFVRVYPLYWLLATLKATVIATGILIATRGELEPTNLIKSFLLWPQINLPIIGAAWTLSYEIVFYALFGSVVAFGARWCVGLFLGWLLLILSNGYSDGALGSTPLLQVFTDERNLEFMLGAAGAICVIKWRPWRPRLLAATGAIAFVLSACYVWSGHEVSSYVLLFGVPAAVLIVGSAWLELASQGQMPRPLVFIGGASYSIYLTHVLFIDSVFLALGQSWPRWIGIGIAGTIAACGAVIGGCLVSYWVEQPVLRFLRGRIIGNDYARHRSRSAEPVTV